MDKTPEIMKLLIYATDQIRKRYFQLFLLEKDDLKDSTKYKDYLIELKYIVDAEKRLYTKKANYFMLQSDIITDFSQSINHLEETLLSGNSNLILLRILNKMSNLVFPLFEDFGQLGELDPKTKMHHAFNLFTFSIFDKECKEEHPNEEVKENMIYIKYNDIYTYHLIEEYLFQTDFCLPSPEETIIELYSYGEDDSFVQFVCENYNYYSQFVSTYDDEDLLQPDTLALIQYILCKVKSSLILLPQNLVKQMHQSVETRIEQKQKICLEKPKLVELINQTFYDAEDDQKRYRL